MTTRRTTLLILGLESLAGVLAVLWFREVEEGAGAPAHVEFVDGAARDRAEPRVALSIGRELVTDLVGSADGSRSIRVVDGRGVPRAAVGVWREFADRSWYVPDGEGWIGSTDAQGRLALPPTLPMGYLAIGIPTCVTQRVATPDEGETTVTLLEGQRVAFRCRTILEDQPVPEAVCAVTVDGDFKEGSEIATIPPSARSAKELVPPAGAVVAPPVDRRVFRAVADRAGLVEFVGLPEAASYFFLAWAPREDQAMVGGPGLRPGDERLVVPGGPIYELSFAKLKVCGYRIEGAKKIGGKLQFRTPSGVIHPDGACDPREAGVAGKADHRRRVGGHAEDGPTEPAASGSADTAPYG